MVESRHARVARLAHRLRRQPSGRPSASAAGRVVVLVLVFVLVFVVVSTAGRVVVLVVIFVLVFGLVFIFVDRTRLCAVAGATGPRVLLGRPVGGVGHAGRVRCDRRGCQWRWRQRSAGAGRSSDCGVPAASVSGACKPFVRARVFRRVGGACVALCLISDFSSLMSEFRMFECKSISHQDLFCMHQPERIFFQSGVQLWRQKTIFRGDRTRAPPNHAGSVRTRRT